MSRKLRKLQKFCYLVTEGKDEYVFVANYVKASRELHVNICDTHAAEDILIYGQEIWSANINTVQPRELVGTLVSLFARCADLSAPMELVYNWGGTFMHERPRAFIRLEGYPQ